MTEMSERELENILDELRDAKKQEDFDLTLEDLKRVNEIAASKTVPSLCVICAGEPTQKGTGWALCDRAECYQKLDKLLDKMYRVHT